MSVGIEEIRKQLIDLKNNIKLFSVDEKNNEDSNAIEKFYMDEPNSNVIGAMIKKLEQKLEGTNDEELISEYRSQILKLKLQDRKQHEMKQQDRMNSILHQLYKILDFNGDGNVTNDELFNSVDINEDGILDIRELQYGATRLMNIIHRIRNEIGEGAMIRKPGPSPNTALTKMSSSGGYKNYNDSGNTLFARSDQLSAGQLPKTKISNLKSYGQDLPFLGNTNLDNNNGGSGDIIGRKTRRNIDYDQYNAKIEEHQIPNSKDAESRNHLDAENTVPTRSGDLGNNKQNFKKAAQYLNENNSGATVENQRVAKQKTDTKKKSWYDTIFCCRSN